MKILISSKELEMLRLLAEGLPDKEIAKETRVEPEIIPEFRRSVLKRIGAQTPVQAFQILAKNGFELQD